ncbi:TPA: NAD-binding protein [Enterococcus faecalis]
MIIGADYIGLEFASMFNSYESKVSNLDDSSKFLPREDVDISTLIYKDFLDLDDYRIIMDYLCSDKQLVMGDLCIYLYKNG